MGDDHKPRDNEPAATRTVTERLAGIHVTHRESDGLAEGERKRTEGPVQGHHGPRARAGTGRHEGNTVVTLKFARLEPSYLKAE